MIVCFIGNFFLSQGHVAGAALTGGLSGGSQQEAAPVQQQQQQSMQQPCQLELQQFLQCAQNQHDITLCEGFNDALKQCKRFNGRKNNLTYILIIFKKF